MKKMVREIPATAAGLATALLLGLLASTSAHALYKVIGPDGKVTYTDRPTGEIQGNRVQRVHTGSGGVRMENTTLPFDLRQPVQRFPVTLYTAAGCAPCDNARLLLKQRGIPYAERTIATPEDGVALQRLTGKTELPAVTIGSQALHGLVSSTWQSYLDAAGYPKTSVLPANHVQPAATPLTTPPAQAAPAPAPAPQPPQEPAPVAPTPNNPSGIRF